MNKVNVLMVEDQVMVRQVICENLRKHPLIEEAYEADDEKSFISALNDHPIGLIVLDIKLKEINGLELLKHLKGPGKRPYIIGLTGMSGDESVMNLMKFGVEGLLFKNDPREELHRAIDSVLNNAVYFSRTMKKIISMYRGSLDKLPPVVLSPREKDFLKALALGLTTTQIAPRFKMSYAYAEKCRKELIKKLGVPNSAALLAFAFRNGIL